MTTILALRAGRIACVVVAALAHGAPAEAQQQAPEPPQDPIGVPLDSPGTCDPYVVTRPSTMGLQLEALVGYQSSSVPLDHQVVGVGVASDAMLAEWIGLGGRAMYVTGGDVGRDEDGDGDDDDDTTNVHQLLVTAGPRLRIPRSRESGFVELELGAGYIAALSGGAPSGALLDVALHRSLGWGGKIGLRFSHGVGATSDVLIAAVTASLGPLARRGGSYGGGCPGMESPVEPRGSVQIGVGGHVYLGGYGLRSGLGFAAPGFAVDLPIRFGLDMLHAIVRADLLWLVGRDRDGVTMHSLLGGLRFGTASFSRTRFVMSVLAGYAVAYGTTPRVADSGPVLDTSVGYELLHEDDGNITVALHARFGIGTENERLAAVFAAIGIDAWGPNL